MPHADIEFDSPSASEALTKLFQIRLAGRGGQGIVTAGDLLGKAAVREGRWAQSIPTFGPERRGALSSATLRIGPGEILLKCSTASPDVLIVFDPTIWHHFNVTLALREGATLIFNTADDPAAIRTMLTGGDLPYRLSVADCRIVTVDATRIALEVLGRPITNTAMMGAFVGATGLVSMDSVEEMLTERFGKRAEANVTAAQTARDGLRE